MFILYNAVAPEQEDYKTIVVDKDALLNHLQFNSRAFNEEVFEQRLAQMTDEELKQTIDAYVREEVLYREAMAMGLDQEDYIIKRRMVQKVEFMTEGISEALIELDEEEINQYYSENKQDYFVPPQVTFTHVFFSKEKWGADQAFNLANQELQFLNANNIPFEQATSRGDRFVYHTNYVQRDPLYVTSHFGEQMSSQVFGSNSSNQWIGPFQSIHGFHLVLLTNHNPGFYPELTEIRDRVIEDAQYWKKQQQNQQTIEALINNYQVKVEYMQNS